MKVHEYQAKEFFAQYGLPVDSPILCRSVDECKGWRREARCFGR